MRRIINLFRTSTADLKNEYFLSGIGLLLGSVIVIFFITCGMLLVISSLYKSQNPVEFDKIETVHISIVNLGTIILQASTLLATFLTGFFFLLRNRYYNEEFYRRISEFISTGAGIGFGASLGLSAFEFVKLSLEFPIISHYILSMNIPLLYFYISVFIGLFLLYVPASVCFRISDPNYRISLSFAGIFMFVVVAINILSLYTLKFYISALISK